MRKEFAAQLYLLALVKPHFCLAIRKDFPFDFGERDNVRVIPDAGDVEIVAADIIAKLSAQTSEDRSNAAWDQRIVIPRISAHC